MKYVIEHEADATTFRLGHFASEQEAAAWLKRNPIAGARVAFVSRHSARVAPQPVDKDPSTNEA